MEGHHLMKEKRVLVLSGGGAKGAYQVGVLRALSALENNDYAEYYGVSVGALNASYLSMFEDFSEGVEKLEQIWRTLETKQIYKKWFLWPLSAFWKPSVYDSSPLEEWVKNTLKPSQYVKPCTVGITSLRTGQFDIINNLRDGGGHSKLFERAVIASASFPGFFKPVRIGQDWYIDGGPRNVTPLKEAIDGGATHIDCVVLDSKGVPLNHASPKTQNVMLRTITIMLDEIMENDIRTCEFYNTHGIGRKIEIRVFRPITPLGINPLKFIPEVSNQLMYRGIAETTVKIVEAE
jgi:NTE family protein